MFYTHQWAHAVPVEVAGSHIQTVETIVRLVDLTYIILNLSAALDTGRHDAITLEDVSNHIENKSIVPWLKQDVGRDLSLLSDVATGAYHDAMYGLWHAYAGNERRKWGIENRGLCLLLSWTNELIQQEAWSGTGLH